MNDNTAQMNNNFSDSTQTPQVSQFPRVTQDPQDFQASQPVQDVRPADSYVNDYQPPTNVDDKPTASSEPIVPADDPAHAPNTPADVSTNPATDTSTNPADTSQENEESLESQNIFFMLGVDDGNEQLRDGFLDELQDVIWDDFLENDVDLLITSDEKVKFDSLMERKAKITDKETDEEVQDALVSYLETLIPDLEEIMLEKALDLKSDLFIERIAGLREYHANNQENLKLILDAEKMMHEDKWYSSAKLLNTLSS